MAEFDLIAKIQAQVAALSADRADVVLGIGDDCALVKPPAGMTLAISTDTLVSGVHFFPDVEPVALGHKALAVNLSDLAAMGAQPLWSTLNLTLPSADSSFVDDFVRGYVELAKQHSICIIGGDTTRGPLNIAVTVIGSVSPALALQRAGARVGDLIFVSGDLGAAAAAVQRRLAGESELAAFTERLERPQPRVALGLKLLGLARCAIDISDGLLAELGHICRASGTGARIQCAQIPVHAMLLRNFDPAQALDFALSGGDDYELCFTAAPKHSEAIAAIASELGLAITPIGEIVAGTEVELLSASGAPYTITRRGFEHF